jgi:hypothetical protein
MAYLAAAAAAAAAEQMLNTFNTSRHLSAVV